MLEAARVLTREALGWDAAAERQWPAWTVSYNAEMLRRADEERRRLGVAL